MGALLEQLKYEKNIDLGVVTATPKYQNCSFSANSIQYYVIHQNQYKFRRSVFHVDSDPQYLKRCVEIVEEFKPDIIHIHGTERFYGNMLTKGLVKCPVIISLQGLMDAYSEWYRWFGKLSVKQIFAVTWRDTLKLSGLLWDLRRAKRQAKLERQMLKGCDYFLGRTDWDRAYVTYFNENAQYFHASRIIRQPFWEKTWSLNQCKKHRIIFTNIRHPRKGVELLLEAIGELGKRFSNLELILIGSHGSGQYGEWIKRKIESSGPLVKVLGRLDGQEIVDELCRSHLFVSASYIENSPNSVAEAQLVGMPVISTLTGGTSSMVKDGVNGLLFPTGDVPLLVEKISSIFQNDRLACRLGENAQKTARKRHDAPRIVQAQLNAYETILNNR